MLDLFIFYFNYIFYNFKINKTLINIKKYIFILERIIKNVWLIIFNLKPKLSSNRSRLFRDDTAKFKINIV
jgi:hypothetical protein